MSTEHICSPSQPKCQSSTAVLDLICVGFAPVDHVSKTGPWSQPVMLRVHFLDLILRKGGVCLCLFAVIERTFSTLQSQFQTVLSCQQ